VFPKGDCSGDQKQQQKQTNDHQSFARGSGGNLGRFLDSHPLVPGVPLDLFDLLIALSLLAQGVLPPLLRRLNAAIRLRSLVACRHLSEIVL
jgi:hypothetical protein